MIFQYTMDAMKAGIKTTTLRKMADSALIFPDPDAGIEPWPTTWFSHRGRIKMQVGRRYSIQAKRGEKAIGDYLCAGLREITNVIKSRSVPIGGVPLYRREGYESPDRFTDKFLEIPGHEIAERFRLVTMKDITFF